MSAPVRFLLVAVAGWALFRGATAGMLPGIETLGVEQAEAAPAPPVVPTEFPPISPPMAAAPAGPDYSYAGYYPNYPAYQGHAAYPTTAPRYVPVPVYYYPSYVPARSLSVPLPPPQPAPAEPEQPPQFYSPVPPVESFDLAQVYPQSSPDWNWRPQQSSRGVLAKSQASRSSAAQCLGPLPRHTRHGVAG